MKRPSAAQTARLSALALAVALAGCSSIESTLAGDRVDYRSTVNPRAKALEVPPDLTQLQRDNRYQPQGGVVSAAATTGAQPVTATPASEVAPLSRGDVSVARDGSQRWLVTALAPEQVWPQVKAFWQEGGFTIGSEKPEAGVMETDWAENRAKLPQDMLRGTIGKYLGGVYETSERDRFRTRIERTATGSEIYISHRGLQEVYINERKDSTMWQPRPADPELEAEMLSRLMVRLGTKQETARTVVQAAPEAPARARAVTGPGAALEVDEPFDRAWRRVGLALDRSGYTVEDRDRTGGLYYVRYIDPKDAAKEEPGFFTKLFGKSAPKSPDRYRIAVKGGGEKTQVSVQSSAGAPEGGAVGQRIVEMLVKELR